MSALALADVGPVRIHPVRFLPGHLHHTKDRFAGLRFQLRPWQAEILTELYSRDPATGLRRYTLGLIGMPRKNGKSELGAGLALQGLVADATYGAEVYSCAGDKDQARLVFGTAKRMVEFSPGLTQSLRIYRDSIVDPNTDSVYRVLSADAPLKHGLNPSRVIFDEVWNQPNRDLWDAMTTGSGVREEPLIVALTTAGFDEDSLLYELYERGRRGKDPRFYFRWVGLPANSRLSHRNERAWEQANPALDDFLRREFLRDQMARLPENVFRRLHLNQWTPAESTWISSQQWDACRGKPEIEPGDEVVIGVDAAMKHDSTAVVICALKDGIVHARFRVWQPDSAQDEVLDLGLVRQFLRECMSTYVVREIAYDPYFFGPSAAELYGEGLPMVEFPQTNERMCPASQSLYDVVTGRRLRHGGDVLARAHALATVAKETERGWRIAKSRSKRKIDAMVALAIATHRLVSEPESGGPAVVVV